MTVFVDTSALYSLLDHDDQDHARAALTWRRLVDEDADLLTNNYVLVEAAALIQHRLGLAAVRALYQGLVPRLNIDWISEEAHLLAVEAVLVAARRGLSLVDCASFRTMRQLATDTAFAFDKHFREQGFE